MAELPIQTFRSAPFKGVNEKYAPHLLDDGESPNCQGVYSTETGAIDKQKGDEQFFATTADQNIIGLYNYRPSHGSSRIITINDNAKAETHLLNGTKVYDLKIYRLFAVHRAPALSEYGICSLPPWNVGDETTDFGDIDGLVWDGVNLWTCSYTNNKIYKHSGFSTTISATYDAPAGAGVAGLAWDGTNIWSCGYDDNKIYKHNMDATLSVALTITIDTTTLGTSPQDITYDPAGFIWVAMEAGNKIAKYTTAGVYVSYFASPTNTPSGIAYDVVKNCLWIYCQDDCNVYKMQGTTLTIDRSFATSNAGFKALAFFYNVLDGFWPSDPCDATNKFAFTTFENKVYFTQIGWYGGIGPVYEYSTYDEYAYFVYNAPAKCRYITTFENYLLVASQFLEYSTIYYRDPFDPEIWYYLDIGSDDGDEIKGWIKYRNNLIVFKANSKWRMSYTGDYDLPFTVSKIDDVGTIGHYTIIEANGYLYFMAWDGIYRFDGVSSVKISEKALKTFSNIKQANFLPVACHLRDINQIWWSASVNPNAPSGSKTVLAYDYLTDSWFPFKYGGSYYTFFSEIKYDDGSLVYLASKGSNVVKINRTYSEQINAQIITKPFDFGIPHKDKQLKRIYVFVKNEASAYNLSFYISVDSKSFEALIDISLYEASGGTRLTRMIDLGERVGKNFQFKFENNNADQPFTIYEYIIEYQVLPRI